MAERVRRWLVIRLVRWSARGWDASYAAYVRRDQDGWPRAYYRFWTWLAWRIEHIALPLARRLNTEDNCMGAEINSSYLRRGRHFHGDALD